MGLEITHRDGAILGVNLGHTIATTGDFVA